MARILVIEDEPDMRDILDHNLRQAGHEVALAAGGVEGLRIAREQVPELVLLDLMLPDLSGNEVCRRLRADADLAEVPIVMLTAKSEEVDRVVGFELGADDYVVKPYSVRELLLRIQAILRRPRAVHGTATTPIDLGLLRIDRDAHRLRVSRAEVKLTASEWRLLILLVERRGRVQARATLLQEVWGLEGETESRTVDSHIKRLREKLGPARDYVETVRGTGYRFVVI